MPNSWQIATPRILQIQWFPLSILIFGQKSCFLGLTIFKIPQPNWYYSLHSCTFKESRERSLEKTTFKVQTFSSFEHLLKGRSFLINHFIDMRTTVNLSISCRKNVFLLKFSNKNTVFLYEMDKLTVDLMSIKWLNKIERPLVNVQSIFFQLRK